MSPKRRLILVDPGMKKPENTTYNLLSNWIADFRSIPDFSIHSVQFAVSFLCNTRLKTVVGNDDVAGIISLGSAANITEHRDWVATLQSDLQPLVFDKQIPFLGICFSHQLLAHMGGNPVGFLHNRAEVANGEHSGFRRSNLVHPKFAALWARLSDSDFASGNRVDMEYREVLKAVRQWTAPQWSFVFAEENHSKLTEAQLRVKSFVREVSPTSYTARVAHEQEVLEITNPDFHTSASSPECEIDALLHSKLPLFSLQSHPETYHESGDGWRLLRNFVYFAGLT